MSLPNRITRDGLNPHEGNGAVPSPAVVTAAAVITTPSPPIHSQPAQRGRPRGATAAPPVPDRLPKPPRRRTAGLAALSVLLVAGGAAAAGVLALRLDQRVPMLVAIHDIAPGQQITPADLSVAPVAADGLDLIPASRQGEAIGRFAAVPIPQGRLIDHRMLAASGLLRAGKAAVGMVLKPGQTPASGVQPGDVVNVVRLGQDTGTVIAKNAVVSSVRAGDTGAFGTTTGDTTATVIVDVAESTDVATAAAGNRVALVLLTRGSAVGTG
jgi:hypothetical protein